MAKLETIVMYGKKGRVIVNKCDQQEWASKGYRLTAGHTSTVDFTTYSDEKIMEFAQQAGLPANVKKRETIIAKLTEAGFMPEAKTE